MHLYFMRHGQTHYNLLHLCNDDPRREVCLTATGIAQAQAAAEQLHDAAIERIIVSELPRTRQTAEIINRYHHAHIETNALLNDIRSGFDSQPVADYFAAIAHDRLNAQVNGGESLFQHKQRVLSFLDWLRQQPQQTILVVAHEETLRVFIAHFTHLGDEQMLDLKIGNCEFVQFTL
jgi:probable phosphoglycerate mutase